MKLRWLVLIFTCFASNMAFAQVNAQGVALSSYSSCVSPAGLDLTMTNGPVVTTETGLVTSETGATLMSFSQGSGFANFSGTFTGYNFSSPAWSVPAGTRVGLYATIGVVPPSAATTGEFFILYRCDTGAVLRSCFGSYGTCPKTAQAALGTAIPTLSVASELMMFLVLALLGMFVLARRRRS